MLSAVNRNKIKNMKWCAGDELKDGDGNEYVPIYQDSDGDWMLVGDVPWE